MISMIGINGARRRAVQQFAVSACSNARVNFVGQNESCSDGHDPLSHTLQPVVADAQRFQVLDAY